MSEVAATVKKTIRRKTTPSVEDTSSSVKTSPAASAKLTKVKEDAFADVILAITQAKDEFLALQKHREETKEVWEKEQQEHEQEVFEKSQQEEVTRKREQETYEYETAKKRRAEEDAFLEKKVRFEKELTERKAIIEAEHQEVVELRRQVAGFEQEKEKAVKEATVLLQKNLTDGFTTEKKLHDQETKAEKELLALKITNLIGENTRLNQEVTLLKKSLEETTRQLKDVAVKVIESSANTSERPRISVQE